MRAFNEREKKIIMDLTSISYKETDTFSLFLQTEFFTRESHMALLVFNKFNKAALYIQKEKFDDLEERKQLYFHFLELLMLLNYLESKRYISFISHADFLDGELSIMGATFTKPGIVDKTQVFLNDKEYFNSDTPYLIYETDENRITYEGIPLSNQVYQIVTPKYFGVYLISEELREFVKNDFKTKEDLRFQKQQIVAWVGIGVALLLGIIGVFMSACI